MPKFTCFLFALILLQFASVAKATTVYQSGVPALSQTPVDAYISDDDNNPAGTWQAVPFTLTALTDINSIMVEGLFINSNIPVSDLFTIAFFSDSLTHDVPGTQIGSGLTVQNVNRTATGVTAFSYQVYHFTMDLSATLELSPGTYWFSIANNTPSNSKIQSWAWTASADGTTAAALSGTSQTSGYTFTDPRTQVFSFQGTNPVPEPTTLALAGLSLLALAARGFHTLRHRPTT